MCSKMDESLGDDSEDRFKFKDRESKFSPPEVRWFGKSAEDSVEDMNCCTMNLHLEKLDKRSNKLSSATNAVSFLNDGIHSLVGEKACGFKRKKTGCCSENARHGADQGHRIDTTEAFDTFSNDSTVPACCRRKNTFSSLKEGKFQNRQSGRNENHGQGESFSVSPDHDKYTLPEDSEDLELNRAYNDYFLHEGYTDLSEEYLNCDEISGMGKDRDNPRPKHAMNEPPFKWRLTFQAQPVQNNTDCQVSSKMAGEGITKLKFERWNTQKNDKCLAKPFIRYKIPPTFPTIFSHFKLVLACLFLYLFMIGPFVRLPTQSPYWVEEHDWTSEEGLQSSSFLPRASDGTPARTHRPPGSGVLLTEAYSSTYNAKDFSRNVTQLLDSLLANYDKRIRPGFGEGQPTLIVVNMNVRSMGPFSEKLEEYGMQLYMRQVWYDSRLKFNKTDLGREEFSMNWMFAAKIWKPDTFFINGKKSYAHAITAPNLFVRLQHDG